MSARRHGYVDALLYRALWQLGDLVYTWRAPFLLVPVLVTIACSTGFAYMSDQVTKSISFIARGVSRAQTL